MDTTMVAKDPFLCKFELKGSTGTNQTTVERMAIIACDGMRYSGVICPGDNCTNSNGECLWLKCKDTLLVDGDANMHRQRGTGREGFVRAKSDKRDGKR